MARYEHLLIDKKALDVAVRFEKVVAGFSRYHKCAGTRHRLPGEPLPVQERSGQGPPSLPQ
jgi:hypothetical protein